MYAQSVAKDFVLDKLGGRTVDRALADGVDAKVVWRAVAEAKIQRTCAKPLTTSPRPTPHPCGTRHAPPWLWGAWCWSEA